MDHHRNTPSTDEEWKKAPTIDTDTTQWDKFLSNYILNLNITGSDFVYDRYDIPTLLKKYSKGGSV